MDLCSKIIHSFWNCQICLKYKGISSLYAMKQCSTGEGTNGVYLALNQFLFISRTIVFLCPGHWEFHWKLFANSEKKFYN